MLQTISGAVGPAATRHVVGTHGRSANNPWIVEQMEKDPFALKLWVNRATAHKKGIRDGYAIWVESPVGKVKGTAALAESIHPECIGFGRGSLGLESIDLVSGAIQSAATRVKMYKVGG